jgi:hypothetical protein
MDNQFKLLFEVFFALKKCGSSLWNNQAFLSDQIHQHMKIMIFIAKGTLRILLMCLVALSGFNHDGTLTPICIQQVFCKRIFEEKMP